MSQTESTIPPKRPNRRSMDRTPDPEMWSALESGHKLRAILIDFYARVYADPRLGHFFEGVTQARAIEKQHSFMQQLFTGERIYFGDRPRNAHHWMVISDELFDYREELMADCLRRAGLAEHLVKRWRAAEERFRKQIVKSEPRPKMLRGIALPLDGFDRIELDVGACCDGCERILEKGASIDYHRRTGRAYCAECIPRVQAQERASVAK